MVDLMHAFVENGGDTDVAVAEIFPIDIMFPVFDPLDLPRLFGKHARRGADRGSGSDARLVGLWRGQGECEVFAA